MRRRLMRLIPGYDSLFFQDDDASFTLLGEFGHESVDFAVADLDTLLFEDIADSLTHFRTFLRSEKKSCAAANDGTAEECIKYIK